MIQVRKKWQIILSVLVFQLCILNLIDTIFIDVSQSLHIVSTIIGLGALNLVLAPSLKIYEYKEDKEKKKQIQKFCNGLSNLKNKIENESQQNIK